MAAKLKIEKRGMKKKSSLNLLSQSQPNFSEIILGWSPFKIVSVSAILYPQQSLVEIGSVVSEEKICFLISSPLFSNLHNRSK
jgi:hypothetical protein